MRSGYDVGTPIRAKEIHALREVEYYNLVRKLATMGVALKDLKDDIAKCTQAIDEIKQKLQIT